MRLKTAELDLLVVIYNKLAHIGEDELAGQLYAVISRLQERQSVERKSCRERAAKNRAAGYAWESSIHPNKSKYYNGDVAPGASKKGGK